MAPGIHSALPRLAIILTPLTLVVLVYVGYRWRTRTYDVPPETDIFAVVAGTWTTADGDCDTKKLTIGFPADHADMMITFSSGLRGQDGKGDSTWRYPLLGHTRHSLRVVRRGETTLDTDSTPVVWELTLRNANAFAWHRSDWRPLRFTRDMQRCPVRGGVLGRP